MSELLSVPLPSLEKVQPPHKHGRVLSSGEQQIPTCVRGASQFAHGPPIGPVKPSLHMQSLLESLPAGESEALGQERHERCEYAPVPREYFPATQLVQMVACVISEYLPPGQLSQPAEEPGIFAYLPGTHAVQFFPSKPQKPILHLQSISTVLPAGASELLGHVSQGSLPVTVLKVPLPQSSHGPPSGPLDPFGHSTAQFTIARLPGFDVSPAGHGIHSALPVPPVYVPDLHSSHGSPSGPVDPSLQIQSVRSSLTTRDWAFRGHDVQDASPGLSLYVCAKHAVQGPPSLPE